MKQTFFLLLSLFVAQNVLAQSQTRESAPNFYKMGISADLNLATDAKNALFALSGRQLFGIGSNRRFKIGYGLRFNQNFGGKTQFLTAPAILTSGKTGPLVIFYDSKPENIDTLQTSSFNITSINIPIYLEYAITNRFDVGFNIDAIGLSFGKSKNNYQSIHSTPNNRGSINAKATNFNLLLVSDNDLGNLNSEFFVRYYLKNKWAINAGATFAFAEVTTDKKLYLDNDRFRQKQIMGMIGVSYRIF